jgi:hypothetical protein
MRDVTIESSEATIGRKITVWYGQHLDCGQGGVVVENTDDYIVIENPLGDRFRFDWESFIELHAEVPYDADECLEYDPDKCSGSVEYRWTGGHQHWLRCEYHGDLRLEHYENSMAKYADSDVAPDWFDPTYAGERWDSDY